MQFTEKSIDEFKCLLNKESWKQVFKTSEVSANLQVYMDTFCYYFNLSTNSVNVSKQQMDYSRYKNFQ